MHTDRCKVRRPNHTRVRSPTLPIKEYVANGDEPKLSRRIAEQSTLCQKKHEKLDRFGQEPSDVGTSRCVGGTNISSHPSLPCLTASPSYAALPSVDTSSGCRVISNGLRVIDEDDDGNLSTFPPLRTPPMPLLQCPFNLLLCQRAFQMGHLDEWIVHSYEHFVAERLSCSRVEPPPSNQCPFCDRTFYDQSGVTSWRQRMRHVAEHHRLGHNLSHARPDFALYGYLWRHKIIGEETYRDIRGNAVDGSRKVRGQPSPPVARNGSMGEEQGEEEGEEEEGEPSTVYTCINDKDRRNRPRRRRS